MQAATFTVVTKRDVRYSANHLSVTRKGMYGTDGSGLGQVSVLNFISSGELLSVPVEEIERVEWHPTGRTYCGECDQSIWNVIGVGLAANPPPVRDR